MVTSLIARTGNRPATTTRRNVLAGCVGLMATAVFAPWTARAAIPRRQGELFAFAAPDRDDVVFALATEPRGFEKAGNDHIVVRLHVGDHIWTLDSFALGYTDRATQGGERIFSGPVTRDDKGGSTAYLVAVAVPAECIPLQSLDVWAEIIGADGVRSRVGNPVVSELLADDARLAKLHAGLHPAADRPLLSDLISCRIAARSDAGADLESRARAKRLAGLLLPDTLRFHPGRASGFTFAAMNGRRPEDAVQPVIQTILAGAPREGRSDLRYRPSDQFPYFASTIAA
jgi:hypothetical protein